MIEPRQYQIESVEAVLAHRENGIRRQLINLPTGTGKTIVFSILAKQLKTKTLILAHREELLDQAASKMRMIWPEAEIGILKADREEIDAMVVIASVQTACRERRLERLKRQGFRLMIVDECHHSAADSYVRVIQELGFMKEDPEKLLVGVSATPSRGDGVGLFPVFERVVFERSLSTMVRGGYLSPLRGIQIFTHTNLKGVAMRGGDFATAQLAERINTPERNRLIVANYLQYAGERRRAIAFCADVQHSIDLAEEFNLAGVPASSVYGDMGDDERKRVLADFRSGKYSVLTNCAILTEGYDFDEIDCVLVTRPTRSESLYVQMIGRGTRLHPAKRDCLVIDFTDACRRHHLCNYKNVLNGELPALLRPGIDLNLPEGVELSDDEIVDPEAKEMAEVEPRSIWIGEERIGEIDFFGRSNFSWVQVGDGWHLRIDRAKDLWVRGNDGDGYLAVAHVDGEIVPLEKNPIPLMYAIGICEDFARKHTAKSTLIRKDAHWRRQPPTDKQRDLLQKIGVSIDPDNYTRGQLAEIIEQKVMKESHFEPASDKQRWKMRQLGIDFSESISKGEAWKRIKVATNNTSMV